MEIKSATKDKDSAEMSLEDISKRAVEAQVRASTELLANLHQMVNEPAFSDVVFVCKDGIRVHASRMLLASRSHVFKSMLMNGMAESSLAEIQLPEILSPVLLSVCEFLYTGTMVDDPQNWNMACELIQASRFFLLPDLDFLVQKFMVNQISIVAEAEDLTMAASLLTEAMEFGSLFDKTDALLRELVIILSSNSVDSFYVRNLSHLAFQYLLVNTRGSYDDDDHLSLKEYLRFRQVIYWWVYRSDFGSECTREEFMNFIAPDEERATSICENPSDVEKVESALEDVPHLSKQWDSFQLDETSRNSAMGLLSNVDCRWIHPRLLAKVVEPLKLISAEEIHNSFRFHALRRPLTLCPLACFWVHGEAYSRTLEKGYVRHTCASKKGLAVMKAPMLPSTGVYQWNFFLEEAPREGTAQIAELGFTHFANWVGAEKPNLDGHSLADVEDSRVLTFIGSATLINYQGQPWQREEQLRNGRSSLGNFPYTSQRVSFIYDSSNGTCSLSINGQDFGAYWKNISGKVFYPAVSLGDSSAGRVRIELVSGFRNLRTY